MKFWYISSDGGYSVGQAQFENDMIVFPDSYMSPEGQRRELRSVWKRTSPTSYFVRTVEVLPDGEKELWALRMNLTSNLTSK